MTYKSIENFEPERPPQTLRFKLIGSLERVIFVILFALTTAASSSERPIDPEVRSEAYKDLNEQFKEISGRINEQIDYSGGNSRLAEMGVSERCMREFTYCTDAELKVIAGVAIERINDAMPLAVTEQLSIIQISTADKLLIYEGRASFTVDEWRAAHTGNDLPSLRAQEEEFLRSFFCRKGAFSMLRRVFDGARAEFYSSDGELYSQTSISKADCEGSGEQSGVSQASGLDRDVIPQQVLFPSAKSSVFGCDHTGYYRDSSYKKEPIPDHRILVSVEQDESGTTVVRTCPNGVKDISRCSLEQVEHKVERDKRITYFVTDSSTVMFLGYEDDPKHFGILFADGQVIPFENSTAFNCVLLEQY